MKIPGVRELATWNLALVMRRCAGDAKRSLTNLAGTRQVHLPPPPEVLTSIPSNGASVGAWNGGS